MKKLTIRFSGKEEEQTHEAIKQASELNHRTLNGEIVHALDYYLRHSPETKQVREGLVKKKS